MRIKRLGFDNGKEHEDGKFKIFYYKNEIKAERTVLGTSHQNGVVEHMNRRLTGKARKCVYMHAYLNSSKQMQSVQQLTHLIGDHWYYWSTEYQTRSGVAKREKFLL